MSDNIKQHFANDREIFDLLMSGKQKITESVLLDIARSRGIFYSSKTSRENLVRSISILPHDYPDIKKLIQRREHSARTEKTTSITLEAEVDLRQIKDIVREYQEEVGASEKINALQNGINNLTVNLEYDEMDYSKTRLIQRQTKEAELEIIKTEGKTIVRLPANDKSRAVVDIIKSKLESRNTTKIRLLEVDLSHILSAELRTKFFLDLIAGMQTYELFTVTSINVARFSPSNGSITPDIDIEGEDEAKDELLGMVNSMLISGHNLFLSEEYQDLLSKGFYIGGLKWQADQTLDPFHRVQFDVAFDDDKYCRKFKYGVSYAKRLKTRTYAKTFRPPNEADKAAMFHIIEETAGKVLSSITAEYEAGGTRK